MWSSLIISVLVCLPPLFLELGATDVGNNAESVVLLSSRETWQRYERGEAMAFMIPSANGEYQLDHPPMSVWLNMLAWYDLDPATVDSDVLVWRARLVSAAIAVMTLIATYWAGMSIGGIRTARLSTMALGTTLLFIYQMRSAGPESHLLGWVTLSIAAGLWAMRPLKPINWVGRRVSGWLLAGLALGAAVLTSGWSAPFFVLPPLVAAILLTPLRRLGNSIGLFFAVVLGLIIATPWYLYVSEQIPEAAAQLFGRITAPEALFLLTWSHLRVLIMLSPWQVWLLGAMCQPFIRADSVRRRQLLIAWFWFVLIFIAFSIPAARHPRYLVPLLPAAALMIGQLWSYHADLASQRQQDPGVNLLRVPHWLIMGLVSVLGPLLIVFEPQLVERGYIAHIELPAIRWPVALGLGSTLFILALLGTRWHFKWRPRLAAYCTTAWMLVASCTVIWTYAHDPAAPNTHREDAEHLAAMAADHQVVYLQRTEREPAPDEPFLFYAGRTIQPVKPDQLPDLIRSGKQVFVMAHNDPQTNELMQTAGFELEFEFTTDNTPCRVYRTMER
ncbi:MAG: hypothetical protein GC162_12235 [Planctomycetes bacterium]|nr:hypothetical protein [Planctomycetota bacterium]